jgi:hypothetical protein
MRTIQALLLLILAAVGVLVFLQLPELRRYLKIRNM